MFEDDEFQTKQIEGIEKDHIILLGKSGIKKIKDILNYDAKEIESIVCKNFPFGTNVIMFCKKNSSF